MGARGGVPGGEVENAAATDGGELMTVTDEREPGSGLIGDGEERARRVLVEHPGLIDQQHIAGKQKCIQGGPTGLTGPAAVLVPTSTPSPTNSTAALDRPSASRHHHKH